MTDKEKKIIYVGTHAADDPEKAAMPFVLACAALAMGINVTITLQGNGVYLAQKGYTENLPQGGGFPPMQELLVNFLELGGILKVCVPCIESRNISISELVEGTQTTGAAALNAESIEADAVMVY
jgi:uncharacterized protein involved in oxidation of intracellular sulfur